MAFLMSFYSEPLTFLSYVSAIISSLHEHRTVFMLIIDYIASWDDYRYAISALFAVPLDTNDMDKMFAITSRGVKANPTRAVLQSKTKAMARPEIMVETFCKAKQKSKAIMSSIW